MWPSHPWFGAILWENNEKLYTLLFLSLQFIVAVAQYWSSHAVLNKSLWPLLVLSHYRVLININTKSYNPLLLSPQTSNFVQNHERGSFWLSHCSVDFRCGILLLIHFLIRVLSLHDLVCWQLPTTEISKVVLLKWFLQSLRGALTPLSLLSVSFGARWWNLDWKCVNVLLIPKLLKVSDML